MFFVIGTIPIAVAINKINIPKNPVKMKTKIEINKIIEIQSAL